MKNRFSRPMLTVRRYLYLVLCVTSLFLVSCGPHPICPTETYLGLAFYTADSSQTILAPFGNKIDTMTVEAFAVSGAKIMPLTSFNMLPIDVSTKQMSFIFKQKVRTDTLIISYDLVRTECIGNRLYLKATNAVFIKNTFNESHPVVHCRFDYLIFE